MLAIEYDVTADGEIELVALVDARDEDGQDPGGHAWVAWRRSLEDEDLGCAPVPFDVLAAWSRRRSPSNSESSSGGRSTTSSAPSAWGRCR